MRQEAIEELKRDCFVEENRDLIDALRKDPQKLKICKELLGGIIKEAPNTEPSNE